MLRGDLRLVAVRMASDAGEDRVIRRIGVAIGAGCPHARMIAAIDGKPRVVEGRTRPSRGGVTGVAGSRKGRSHVVGVGSAGIVGLVTAIAKSVGGGEVVVIAHVTLRALQTGMSAGERESRSGVIERRAGPVRGGVADRAVLREAGRSVRRVGGDVVIGEVAVNSGAAGQAIVVVHVTLRALQTGMSASERKPRSGVIERRASPVRGGMAAAAILREVRGFMRRIVGIVVVRNVAVDAGPAGQVEVATHMA